VNRLLYIYILRNVAVLYRNKLSFIILHKTYRDIFAVYILLVMLIDECSSMLVCVLCVIESAYMYISSH